MRKSYAEAHWERRLRDLIPKLPFESHPTIFISEENFSIWKQYGHRGGSDHPVQRPFWGEAPRQGSHPIVRFLAELNSALPDNVELLTIITLRAQKTYLPSQAAQYGEPRIGPILRRIRSREDQFVLWDQLVQDLEILRGADKHLTLLFEDGLESNAREIVRFCQLEPTNGAFDFNTISSENVRSADGSQSWIVGTQPDRQRARSFTGRFVVLSKWVTGGRELPTISRAYILVRRALFHVSGRNSLQVSPKQESQLREYVTASNQRLGIHLGRNLKPLGYD